MKEDNKGGVGQQKSRYLAELLQRIAVATDRYPTVRCWSGSALRSFLTQLRTDLLGQKLLTNSFPRSDDILRWLGDSGLAFPLPVSPGTSVKNAPTFYLLEVGAGVAPVVSPYELLQAYQPAGVVCFFSALSFHGLTTQIPPFHHSALLMRRPVVTSVVTPKVASNSSDVDETRVARNSLGSPVFSYGNTAYYSTKRYADLVPGIQVHVLDKRIHLRVTDLEQSILDTLVHPEAAGAQAVVFEAWEQGWDRVRQSTITQYLQTASLALTRRFGAMSKLLKLQLTDEILRYLDETKRKGIGTGNGEPINLLRGSAGQKLDQEWNVLTPR